MKRIIGIITAFVLLIGMAAVPVLAKPYTGYPWVYEDFETDAPVDAVASNASVSRVAGGVADTKGAARITVTKDYGTAKFPLQLKKGTTYQVSAWVKMVGDIPADNNFHFIFYMRQKMADGTPSEGMNCFKDIVLKDVAYSRDEYTYVHTTFIYDGKGRLNGADVETCDGDATVEIRISNGTLASTNNNPIDYLLDDLIVEPVMSEEADVEKDTSIGMQNGNFETGYDAGAWVRQNCNTSLTDGANGTKNGLMITSTGTYGQIKQRAPMDYNKAYRISIYAKAGNSATVGKEFKLIIDRKDGKTDNNITTNYEFLPATALVSEPSRLILDEEWQKLEMIYKPNLATYETTHPYMYPRVGSGTDMEVYCIDEWEVEELPGIVYNGDFSEGTSGWVADGTTAEVSADKPEGAEQSLKITETSNYGGFKQGIHIQQGKTYQLSFWAKGESWASGTEELEFHPVLDRYAVDATGDDIYQYLYLDDGSSPLLTKEWKYYEFNFTVNVKADHYRVPLLYLELGNAKQKATYYLAQVTIRDMEPEEPEKPGGDVTEPAVSNLAVTGKTVANHGLTLTYDYAGPEPAAGLVKMMKSYAGKYVSVGSATMTGEPVSYTAAASDVGSTVKFFVIPIDAQGVLGKMKTIETNKILSALNIEPVFTSDLDAQTVTAEVRIDNNDKNHNIVVMLALFDENNAMTAIQDAAVQIEKEEQKILPVSVHNPGGAVKARIFVWEGISMTETTMESLIANVSLDQ